MKSIANKPTSMIRHRLLTCIFAVSLFSLAWPLSGVAAQPFASEESRSDNYFSQPAGISRKEAARRARDATDGKVIAIKPARKGNDGYNVRLVVDGGRVVTVRVDRSGKVHR